MEHEFEYVTNVEEVNPFGVPPMTWVKIQNLNVRKLYLMGRLASVTSTSNKTIYLTSVPHTDECVYFTTNERKGYMTYIYNAGKRTLNIKSGNQEQFTLEYNYEVHLDPTKLIKVSWSYVDPKDLVYKTVLISIIPLYDELSFLLHYEIQ